MLDGINDKAQHARELIELVKDVPCKFNLIPFNPFPNSGYERSTNENIRVFAIFCNKPALSLLLRKTRGDDIDRLADNWPDKYKIKHVANKMATDFGRTIRLIMKIKFDSLLPALTLSACASSSGPSPKERAIQVSNIKPNWLWNICAAKLPPSY